MAHLARLLELGNLVDEHLHDRRVEHRRDVAERVGFVARDLAQDL
jgi:hypothetical protein